ncbi:unnamed protein product [Spirodela intermedia]|uniref:Uncharacterized protein n=1 Tax=Spirodela intermedia TaxID=51605 RepID=A0A7I8JFV4_SPIIN|nr:unnamed protein product [Spirodela intermedia]CAA6669058.1 unnamed protein product [Spirodela intermedia]
MDIPSVMCMKGGEEETSYTKNCSLQARVIDAAKSSVDEAVVRLLCATNAQKLTIADLGCASGQNTLSVVANITDTIEQTCQRLGRFPPEVHLFLNDLPRNDFNSVFSSLQSCKAREATNLGRCFIAGVAGSFYGRLFPRRSIDFFHSSSSLHWLSQDPLKAHQKNGLLLNKGSIFISEKSLPFVLDAYSRQFKQDFSDFLKFRSIEMATGDGYITEEKVDSFNIPLYPPCVPEVAHEILTEGSFSLDYLKVFELDYDIERKEAISNMTKGERVALSLQAVFEPLLASHFGSNIIEGLFSKFSNAIDKGNCEKERKMAYLMVSLIRKS